MITTIKRVCTGGPYGDETSRYEIEFPKDTQLGELINTIVATHPKEFGNIWVNNKKVVEYGYGAYTLFNWEDFYKITDRVVISANASGGWGMMDYTIAIEKNPPLPYDASSEYKKFFEF
jgi:hypothetical protein